MAKHSTPQILKGKKLKKEFDIAAPPKTRLPTDKAVLRKEIRKEIYKRSKEKW